MTREKQYSERHNKDDINKPGLILHMNGIFFLQCTDFHLFEEIFQMGHVARLSISLSSFGSTVTFFSFVSTHTIRSYELL